MQVLTGAFYGARGGVAPHISSSVASRLVGRYAGHRFPKIDKVIKKLVALRHLKHKQMHWARCAVLRPQSLFTSAPGGGVPGHPFPRVTTGLALGTPTCEHIQK